MDEKKIVSADVGTPPKTMFDSMPMVTVTFDDKTSKRLFQYYPDEIQFTPEEFVGLTEAEAFKLRHNKDVKYLQS